MDLIRAGQVIRDTVSMETVLSLYGYDPPRHGFMRCPFHAGDNTASLKVYSNGKGWHCFGCGKGGSVIDFVMEHEECNYSTAVIALDRALELGLTVPGNPYKEEEERRLQRALDGLEKAWLAAIDGYEREIDLWIERDFKKTQEIEDRWPEDQTAKEWIEYGILTDEMEWLEFKKKECENLRKEVMEWRKEGRRVEDRGKAP